MEKVENSPTKQSFMNLKAELTEPPFIGTTTQNISTNTNITSNPNAVTLPNRTIDPDSSDIIIDDNKLDVGDSYLGFLRNKKSSIETSINSNTHTPNSTISDPKLKKATNPSIASLRGISELSTPNGTISKGSSRAEFFAAKLHYAIKDDNKNKDDSNETFVYDTTTNGAKSTVDQDLDFGTGPANGNPSNTGKCIKDDKSTIADSHSIVTPSELNTVNQGSPYFNKYGMDDTFDLISKSSINSRRQFQRKLSKDSAMDDTLQPIYSKDDNSNLSNHNTINNAQNTTFSNNINCNTTNNNNNNNNNQLRQITSRLFDSKGVKPRRYSGVDNDVSLGDSFDEDFDYYESNMLNQQPQQSQPHHHLNDHSNTNVIYSIDENDSDFEDQLSNYFRMNNPRNQQIPGTVGNNRNTNSGSIHAYHQFNDYGSISNDFKQKLKKKRNDIYISPHDFTSIRTQRIKQVRNFCYTAIGIISLLFTGFILGFILATNKELQSVDVIDVTDVLISQEALIFDMVFDAFNPGLLPLTIKDVQLDIFAKTTYAIGETPGHNDDGDDKRKYDTVLLGSIEKLELPLSFNGGFLTRQHDVSVTEMKILNPCSYDDDDDDDDDDGDDDEIDTMMAVGILQPNPKWLNISRNPFDLIVRGAMIYHLPLSNSNHTISVSYTTYIEPDKLDV